MLRVKTGLYSNIKLHAWAHGITKYLFWGRANWFLQIISEFSKFNAICRLIEGLILFSPRFTMQLYSSLINPKLAHFSFACHAYIPPCWHLYTSTSSVMLCSLGGFSLLTLLSQPQSVRRRPRGKGSRKDPQLRIYGRLLSSRSHICYYYFLLWRNWESRVWSVLSGQQAEFSADCVGWWDDEGSRCEKHP